MSSMSEKSRASSKFISLVSVCAFFLILSCVFLLQSGNTSFLPRSVFDRVLVNGTSVYFEPHVEKEPIEFHSEVTLVDEIKPSTRISKSACQITNPSVVCDSKQAVLRVYMYDLPPEFHFGLLGWKGSKNQTWPQQIPRYPGGLNLQHSIEYWLTLDILSSENINVARPCTIVRVHNAKEADFIFVPFFSSLSYNRYSKLAENEKVSVNQKLQDRLVNFLMGQKEWKRKGGKDHLIVAHHPNSILDAREKLGSAMFVLADFGRYPAEIANLEKDVIAPYKHLVTTVPISKSATFKERPILVYFRGAIYRKDGGVIRQELYYLLKDEKDVDFNFGSVGGNGVRKATEGMASSKFCLNVAGDTPSSNRLFDAIASHCVPVIISDDIELPFEDVLDYSQFCIFVRGDDAVKKGYLLKLLRGIKEDKWTKMWERLKEVVRHFEYQYPSQPCDAVDMIWQAVTRKFSSIQNKNYRIKRYGKSKLVQERDGIVPFESV